MYHFSILLFYLTFYGNKLQSSHQTETIFVVRNEKKRKIKYRWYKYWLMLFRPIPTAENWKFSENLSCKFIEICNEMLNLNLINKHINRLLIFHVSQFHLDINECSDSNLNDCSEEGLCFNVFGTYLCKCRTGYVDPFVHDERKSGRKCSGNYNN